MTNHKSFCSQIRWGIASVAAVFSFNLALQNVAVAQSSLSTNVVTYVDSEYTVGNGDIEITDSLGDSVFSGRMGRMVTPIQFQSL